MWIYGKHDYHVSFHIGLILPINHLTFILAYLQFFMKSAHIIPLISRTYYQVFWGVEGGDSNMTTRSQSTVGCNLSAFEISDNFLPSEGIYFKLGRIFTVLC